MGVKGLKCFTKEHGNLHILNYNLHLEVFLSKEGGVSVLDNGVEYKTQTKVWIISSSGFILYLYSRYRLGEPLSIVI